MPEIVEARCGMCEEERVVARLQVAHCGELVALSLCRRCLISLAVRVYESEIARPYQGQALRAEEPA